jgi:hypothetical protein
MSSRDVACLDPARFDQGHICSANRFCKRAGERSLPSEKKSWGVRPETALKRVGFPRSARDKLLSFTIVVLFCFPASAQDQKQPANPSEPTITFDLFWEAATPQSYTITVESSGKAKYVSRNPTRPEEGSDPDYQMEFALSPANRDRLFVMAKDNNYFKGNFEFKHKVASTGRKTLTYADPTRHFETTYNFSENKDIAEITRLFQGISNTIEHGRKLQFLRRFDKLGLDSELKGMEDMNQNGYLAEIQIIAPLLQNLANDSSILHMARERAKRLLAGAETPGNRQ